MALNKQNLAEGKEISKRNMDKITDYLLNNVDMYKWLSSQILSINDALLNNLKESLSDVNIKRHKLHEAIGSIHTAMDALKWIWDEINTQEIKQLDSINNSLKIKKFWEDKKLLILVKKNYQWWFSDAIFNYPKMIGYILQHNGSLGGIYAQSFFRTKKLDTYIEEKMREKGLHDWEIAVYLISKACRRHFKQYNDNEKSIKNREYVEGYDGHKFQWTVEEKKRMIDDNINAMCEAAKLEEI